MAALASRERQTSQKAQKPRIGGAHDPAEHAADRIADVLTAAAPPQALYCSACAGSSEPCPACAAGARNLRRSAVGPAPTSPTPAVARVLSEPGGALPDGPRSRFERRLGRDLSAVRLHTGPDAARAAQSVNARAFAAGAHIAWGAGSPDPASTGGERLLAHEVAHTLQDDAGSLIRRETRTPTRAPEETPAERLLRLLGSLETEALPAFQRALDGLDEPGIRAAGRHVLLLWHLVDGSRDEVLYGTPTVAPGPAPERPPPRSPPPAPAPGAPAPTLAPELATPYERVRGLVVSGLLPRRYRGNAAAGALALPTELADVGFFIWEQTDIATWLVRDTAQLLELLRHDTLTEGEQWSAIGLLRQHQQPTRFAFMLAVLEANGLASRPEHFVAGPRDAFAMMRNIQPELRRALESDVLAEPGAYAVLPAEGRVRLLLPATPAELASEFYGEAERWQDVLKPYNRAVLASANGGSWLPAGTELVMDPQLMVPRYRGIFIAAPAARRQAELGGSEPYLWQQPDGPIVVGNTVAVGVSWPNSLFGPQRLAWWAENDPYAVRSSGIPARVDLGSGVLDMGPGERTRIESRALAPGNHQIKCRLTNEEGASRVLSHSIVVLTLAERTDIASRYSPPPLRRPAEMLADLRTERAALPESASTERTTLDRRIAELERAINEADTEARRYRGPGSGAHFTPIRAIYVSAEEAPMTVPLQIFVDTDPGYFDAPDTHLILWDFTLASSIRHYTASGRNYDAAMRSLLRTFADDAPYPTGNIRFLNVDFTPVGPYFRPPETLTCPTDGGTALASALRALSMGAMAVGVVGAAALQPEIALPAFVVSGLLAGAAGAANLYDRLSHGDFEWDLQTGMDILDIAAALLTVGVASGVTTSVSRAGRMTVTGTLQLRIGQAQLGIMAGVHMSQISAAVASGNRDSLAQALLRAAGDGALVLIVHRSSRRLAGAEPELRPAEDLLPLGSRRSMGATSGGGERPPPSATEAPRPAATVAEAHDRAVAETLRSGMGVRPPPLPARPGAAPIAEGSVVARDIPTLAEARRIFDESSARAPGREVAIWRNRRSGAYAVTVGSEGAVSAPAGEFGEWAGVQHIHPNEGNVLTYRNPAPQDVNNALVTAFLDGRPHTEFIEHRLPTGGRRFTAYTAHPDGRITIEFERPDGSRSTRSFASLADYQADWGSRTRGVSADPKNPEYRDLMRDIDEFYSGRRSGGATMSGTVRDRPASGREAERAARAESMAWWRSPGVTTETRFARHDQSFRSIAATLRNLAGRRGAPIAAPNERVLDMPVDAFIRSRPALAAELRAIERDAAGNPELRRELTEFLEGRLEAGAREVGGRRPDLVEFFLERGDVIVTDYTLNTSRVHRLKTAFYREVMAALLGRRGPRVSSLDINLNTGEQDVRPY